MSMGEISSTTRMTLYFFEIRVVCTDRGTHPSRELALLKSIDDPEFRDALHADNELTAEEAEAVSRWDRVQHFTRDARRGGEVRVSKVEFGWTQNGEVEVGDKGDGRGPLWRFRCPTCERDVPMRDDTLVRLVEGLIAAGRRSVDISYLPANMA